ncbi:LamG domain-containing protein [Puia dinghuensis]|uniref:LamG domain-containing protein n=1 Tax=Puia dinghuensis TaxID=1792502 RepID=A0A8J2XQS5_9BACT|nr:LamG domain-containing protein [Puia dinghuensis]GGA86221.1 hypothetical protein GCM10011511_06580 [Puia dinghuensis]
MKRTKILSVTIISGLILLVFSIACNKNPVTPPVHDTVTVIKNDTTTLTDTLYASKPDSTVNLKKGLLLYLPFTGNMADSSGNGNPTTPLNGASLTYDEHGYAKNAFGANGTNQVLLVTNNGSIKFDTAFSTSLDFMTVDESVRHDYLSMIDWNTALGPSFEYGNNIPSAPSILLNGVSDVTLGCSNYAVNTTADVADSTGFTPQLDRWYNLIVIYHRGTIQTYINGHLLSSKTGTGTAALLCPASQVVVGGWWVNDPVNLDGAVDNIRMYNRVLTPHEIAALSANYQVTSNSQRPGLRTH